MIASFSIKTKQGDALIIEFSTSTTSFLSDAISDRLDDDGIEIVGIVLQRVEGIKQVGIDILAKISELIANFFYTNENVILFYYCDDVNEIPLCRPNNARSPQEYRSRIFSHMFERFATQRGIRDINDVTIKIDALDRSLYMHFIVRDAHMGIIEDIKEDMNNAYSK